MQGLILGLINPLIAMIFASTFFAMWWRDRSRMDVANFALAYMLLGTGFFISHLINLDRSTWALGVTHLPFSLGTIALVAGVCIRNAVEVPLRSMITVAILGGALLAVDTFVNAGVVSGLYIANTTYGIMMVMCAQLIARKPRDTALDAFVFWMVVFTAAQFFVRPAMSFMLESGITTTFYRETIYYSVLNATVTLVSLSLALALIGASIQDQFHAQRIATSRDVLSGLLSRQSFEGEVRLVVERAARSDVPLALIIADLDHFKKINDIWGHQVGDRAIAGFGELISRTIRDYDVAGRVGGEEFCVLVWNADEKVAAALADRLRVGVGCMQIEGMTSNVRLTASFGAAGGHAGEGYHSLFKRADKALYRAKRAGRNRVAKASEKDTLVEDRRSAETPDSGAEVSTAAL